MGKPAIYKSAVVGDVLIGCTTAGAVSDKEWEDFINDLKTKPITKYLSLALGSVEATSVQRKAAAEATKMRGIRSAIVTEDRLVRGLVTAASWLGANIEAFSWKQIPDAITYLRIGPGLDQRVLSTANALKAACETEAKAKGLG
jgi:hypothetical protein